MNTHHRCFPALSLAFALFQLCALYEASATFTVKITLQGNGVISYDSTSQEPGQVGPNGVIEEPGTESFKIEEGNAVFFEFFPSEEGSELERVTDNGEDVTSQVEDGRFYQIAVIRGNHNVVARFTGAGPDDSSPTGDFNFAFKEGGASTPIVDVTGNYSGIIPHKKNPFTVDVAMDEAGKLDAIALVTGFNNSKSNAVSTAARFAKSNAINATNAPNEVQASGSLKTVNGKPTASGGASIAGTLDGDQVSGSGKAKIPIVVTPVQGGSEVQGIVVSGSAKENGEHFKEPATMVAVPAQTGNVSKSWNLALSITEETDAKGKKSIVASSILSLPNGDKTQFKEKKTRYSTARGYSIRFSRGVKLDPQGNPIPGANGKPLIDKKSRVVISRLLLQQTGGGFAPTDGSLIYKFLGQKGKGDVVDFL